MYDKIKDILAENIEVSKDLITSDANLRNDLCIDSINIFAIITDIEEEFNIDIDDKLVANFITVNDIVKYIEETKK